MPNEPSIMQRPWFWPALLAAAIAVGAIVEMVRTPAAPTPDAPRENATAPVPKAGAPGTAGPAPAAPGIPRAAEGPGSQPLVHAELPRAHPAPGSEPPVPLTANRQLDPRRVLDASARRWADSVRGVRPEILEQMRLGKLQERERLQREVARVEESLRASPGNEALSRQIETLQNNLYYLDRSILYLEQAQGGSR